ncbi:YafY family transcriptional regulator [Belliella sp. R4-6]|uniref:YafY family transcriptional regulator n=1 Tax=Belliella alkalica TaxID=1730871 RepID=A0ABS9VEV7_9BACT|nr:YafY family protein [Belliella alkalica]MCH7414982.1 YafY family transcriptional regulator [Belliella alkalica]
MNRLKRLTAILTQLQSKNIITAQSIADRFEISLRTVYRDIRALEESGVPISSEAGIGYKLVEGYRLPPLMFTKEEALSFLVAEKIYEKITEKGMNNDFQSGMIKIKAVLRHAEKSTLEELSHQIEVMQNLDFNQIENKGKGLQEILNSLVKKCVLNIDYISFEKEEKSTREIEPIGIYYAFDKWYLIAWCRLRKAYRTFRVDRIQKISSKEETFPDRHPSLKAYLAKIQKQESLIKVVILIPKNIIKYLQGQKFNYGFVMQKEIGENVEMTFMTVALENILRWLIIFADQFTVVEPPEFKIMIGDLLREMMKKQLPNH